MISDSAEMGLDVDLDSKIIECSIGREICVTEAGEMLDLYEGRELGREGSVISRRFLCNKEGFRVNNNKTRNTRSLEVRKPRQITREGCKAMIMVRKEKTEKWVVTKLETKHNHPMGISVGKGRRCTVQARPQDEKDKKIRELSTELSRANQQIAQCQEQLKIILKYIEQYANHLTKSVQKIVENVKEVEAEGQE
ncbi:hypothetical protein ACB094_12G161100 [Castanea mollissima]